MTNSVKDWDSLRVHIIDYNDSESVKLLMLNWRHSWNDLNERVRQKCFGLNLLSIGLERPVSVCKVDINSVIFCCCVSNNSWKRNVSTQLKRNRVETWLRRGFSHWNQLDRKRESCLMSGTISACRRIDFSPFCFFYSFQNFLSFILLFFRFVFHINFWPKGMCCVVGLLRLFQN